MSVNSPPDHPEDPRERPTRDAAEGGSFRAEAEAGERLDVALQKYLPDLSRSALQRLISAGQVRVEGRSAKAGQRLFRGELVEWEAPHRSPSPSAPSAPKPEPIPLQVIYEDVHLLVIDKPSGLVVHPAPGHSTGTLVNAVLAHAGDEMESGESDRPGIVHRLDKDTSGLMVVAKTESAHRALQAQIQARTAERRYLALVLGSVRFEHAEVDAPIGRHPTDRKRMGVIRPGSRHTHRSAQTELRVLERLDGVTLLEARLLTGRTHQIRVHCAYIHYPVLGDPLYGPRRPEKVLGPETAAAVQLLEGQALHAYRLSFEHPVRGGRLQFLAPPSPDFQQVLDRLGSRWKPVADDPWASVEPTV
jgi:23S rRNA pseudouridine1911/1915/1917 synthase